MQQVARWNTRRTRKPGEQIDLRRSYVLVSTHLHLKRASLVLAKCEEAKLAERGRNLSLAWHIERHLERASIEHSDRDATRGEPHRLKDRAQRFSVG